MPSYPKVVDEADVPTDGGALAQAWPSINAAKRQARGNLRVLTLRLGGSGLRRLPRRQPATPTRREEQCPSPPTGEGQSPRLRDRAPERKSARRVRGRGAEI